jgi:protein SMG6
MHLDPAPDVPKPSRRAIRDREPTHRDPQRVPAPTDLAERMIAFQRRTAACVCIRLPPPNSLMFLLRSTRPRERVERQPPHPNPRPPEKSPIPSPSISPTRLISTSPRKQNQNSQSVTQKPDADPDDFSRRLRISSSPVPRTSPPSKNHTLKLFNPGTDTISMRQVAEPESISDGASSSGVPRSGPKGSMRDAPARQLFDHRKDDPVRFAVLARPQGRAVPTPKSSADYLSASSTSSYANSVTSSNFTLSSNTDDSSASSALFDRQGKPNEGPGTNIFAGQLKKLYRTISTLEEKVKQEDADDASEEGIFMLNGKEVADDDLEREKWKKQIENHKR